MSEIAKLAATSFNRAGGHKRFVVAVEGPPGSGKSTLAERLGEQLEEGSAVVVPMDGFHFDDVVFGHVFRGSRTAVMAA